MSEAMPSKKQSAAIPGQTDASQQEDELGLEELDQVALGQVDAGEVHARQVGAREHRLTHRRVEDADAAEDGAGT